MIKVVTVGSHFINVIGVLEFIYTIKYTKFCELNTDKR